nr:putative nucleotidyltransferase, ribonuclease H [Tanacetum cinerariifolium]
KYTLGHKCSGKLYFIVFLANKELESKEEYMEEESSMPEELPQVSFNALNGANSFQTVRIIRKIRKHEVHILVDCGATHNFLDVNVAKQVGCKTNKTYPLEVAAGGGRKFISNVVCKNFEWQLKGETFYRDMMILPLGGCEMVLGIQAKNRMKQHADKCRSERQFDIRDWVLLKLQPHRQVTVRMGKQHKFSPKYYGPFKVISKVGQLAYQLELNSQAQIHNVFHVSQLKGYKGELPRGHLIDIPLCDQDGKLAAQPLKILDRKIVKKKNVVAIWVNTMD